MKYFFDSELLYLIIGAVLTMITSIIVKKYSYKDSLNEKIVEERIIAYKKIYDTVSKLGYNISLREEKEFPKECYIPYIEKGKENIRIAFCFPNMFLNFRRLHEYKKEIAYVLNENKIFLEQEIYNKTFLIDHYLGEIWHITNGKDDKYIQMIGFMLSSELDKMQSSVEKDIQDFFLSNKTKMNSSNSIDPFIYAKEKYKKTELYKIEDELKKGMSYGDFSRCNNCLYYGKCPVKE